MNISKDIVLAIVLAGVVIASGIDLYTDVSQGATYHHTIKESLVVLFSVGGIGWLLASLRRQRTEIRELTLALDRHTRAPRQPEDYVLDTRKRFGDMVTRQFEAWDLTTSEKEVGWLLLKGLSLREIAVIRNTLEKTVRQQASAIYHKAELPGRHAFSAWFMEELF